MRVTFLGTSAGTPTRTRNVTSQALTFEHGGLWLLDCGEATQHQLMRAGLKPSHCERILITHLHGIRLCVTGEPVRELGHFLALVPLFPLESGDGEGSQIGWPHRAGVSDRPDRSA